MRALRVKRSPAEGLLVFILLLAVLLAPRYAATAEPFPREVLLLTVRENLFSNTPLVFCGLNNFTPKRILGQSNITEFNEAQLLAPHYGIATGERLCG